MKAGVSVSLKSFLGPHPPAGSVQSLTVRALAETGRPSGPRFAPAPAGVPGTCLLHAPRHNLRFERTRWDIGKFPVAFVARAAQAFR